MPKLRNKIQIVYLLLITAPLNSSQSLEKDVMDADLSSLTFDDIGKWLALPLSNIPQLVIMMKKEEIVQQSANIYTQWFLRNVALPKTILTYRNTSRILKTAKKVLQAQGNSFAIVIDSTEIENFSATFTQKAGSFFYILADPKNITLLSEVFYKIWHKKKIIMNYILCGDGVLFYDPFQYDSERYSYGKIIKYNATIPMGKALFSNMRGYPLRIQFFRSVYARPIIDPVTKNIERMEGVDGEVANLLQERMNFSMILQDPDPNYFGDRSPNGSYNGVIGSIVNDQVDLCLTGFFVKDYMVPEMHFTVAVYDDQLCIYAPKAARIPQSILPIYSVRYDLWIGFIMIAFVCGTIWCVIRTINNWLKIPRLEKNYSHLTHLRQYYRIYIDTWVVWVRVNILRFPPFDSERVFIASLCLVSVIFGAIFESSLATVYIHPMYYKDINSLKELDETGFKIIYKYSSMADDLFYNETSPLFARLNKKLRHMKNFQADVMLEIAQKGGKAGVTRYTTLMLESLHFVVSKKIWIVPDCPKYYTISYTMPKDSPWEEAVNNLLLKFIDAGLIEKWIKEMKTEVDIKISTSAVLQDSEVFKVLTNKDLQLAFYLLMLGNIVSGILFLMERYLSNKFLILKKCFQFSTN